MYSENSENFLYNIKTGKAASEKVADFLLNVEKKGCELRNKFIEECSQSENHFEEPIRKNEIFNFSKNQVKKTVKLKDKVMEVQMQRDLFGHMLGISINQETDIEKLFDLSTNTCAFIDVSSGWNCLQNSKVCSCWLLKKLLRRQ